MTATDDLTIIGAAERIAAGGLSCVELLELVLARLDETEPSVHAYVTVMAERALESARQADAELASGTSRGTLHGIPFGVKDVLCTHDAPTEGGSRVLAGYRPGFDATGVRRLREAGAILLGKHVTQEFALGQNIPETRNPWNAEHWSGGSSAGSGVAVTVGSALAALGTDAGGSVRLPAALSSIVGLKPTYGRVSSHGVIPPTSSVDHVGVMTRSVADCAAVLQAVAGADPSDPCSIDEPVPDYLSLLGGGARDLRLGVARGEFFDGADEDVLAAAEDALRELEQLGAQLVPVDLPGLTLVREAALVNHIGEAATSHRQWLADRAGDYGRGTRVFLTAGALIPTAYYEAARRVRGTICRAFQSTFDESRLDALVLPTLPTGSFLLSSMKDEKGQMTSIWNRLNSGVTKVTYHTGFANVTGQPALTVPCGFAGTGVPIGLQFVGRPFDETTLFRLGHAFQRATDWHRQRPVVHGATHHGEEVM